MLLKDVQENYEKFCSNFCQLRPVKPFQANVPLLYPLKRVEYQRFSDVFSWWYKKREIAVTIFCTSHREKDWSFTKADVRRCLLLVAWTFVSKFIWIHFFSNEIWNRFWNVKLILQSLQSDDSQLNVWTQHC